MFGIDGCEEVKSSMFYRTSTHKKRECQMKVSQNRK